MLAHLDRMARDEVESALNVTADLLNEPAQQAYLALVFKRREKMGLIFKNSFRASNWLREANCLSQKTTPACSVGNSTHITPQKNCFLLDLTRLPIKKQL